MILLYTQEQVRVQLSLHCSLESKHNQVYQINLLLAIMRSKVVSSVNICLHQTKLTHWLARVGCIPCVMDLPMVFRVKTTGSGKVSNPVSTNAELQVLQALKCGMVLLVRNI